MDTTVNANNGNSYDALELRSALDRTTNAPLGVVRPTSPVKALPIYPQVIYPGGNAWSFDGLSLAIYPSPYNTRWPNGYVPAPVRQQMMLHPKVSQSVHNLKAAIIGDGGRSIPCAPPSSPDFAYARMLAEFSDYVFRNCHYYESALQLLDAVHSCNKIGALVFKDVAAGKYAGKRVLEWVQIIPDDTYTFYHDEYGKTNYVKITSSGTLTNSSRSNEYSIDKFIVVTYRKRNNSPIGFTCLAPAYDPWYKDVHCDAEEMAYAAQWGRPSVIVFSAPPPESQGGVETPAPLWYKDGTPVMEPNPEFNPALPVGPENSVMKQREGYSTEQNRLLFTEFRAGSIWSLAGNSIVQIAEARAGGGDFFRFLREANARQIAAAIYGTHQMTESERNVSTANAEVGEGVAGLNVTAGKVMLEIAEERDILKPLLRMNFGPRALDFLPIRDYGSGQNGRIPKIMNSVVGLVTNGAFTDDQWYWFCAGNGLPLPYPESKPAIARIAEYNAELGVKFPKTGGGDKTGGEPGKPQNEDNAGAGSPGS